MALSAHRLATFPQPPPPALAAGLRQLLAEAAAAVGAAPGAAPGNSSGGGLALSPGLQLCKLAEHADRFEAELAVGASLGGTLSSSGLTYEFPGAPPGGGACDSVKVRALLCCG